MIIYMGYMKFAEGEIARLRAEFEAHVTGTRAEEGCEYYAYSLDMLDPNIIVISERWRDDETIKAHFTTPHAKHFIEILRTANIEKMSVKAYDKGEVKSIRVS